MMDYVKLQAVVESMLGASVGVSTWWLWNQIPVTLGNLLGGMVFTGLAIYFTHRQAKPIPQVSSAIPPRQTRSGDRPEYSVSF